MPMYLEPRDVTADLEGVSSVLIVSCPICPQMSLAMQKKAPFIEFFKHGFKTAVFEDYIKSIQEPLEQRGVRTDVFTMRVPSPLMCVWTERQRRRLRDRAKNFEAVLVLGCQSATATARQALKDTNCEVIQAMRMRGMANATMKCSFPATVELDANPSPTKRQVRRRENHVEAATETKRSSHDGE